MHTRWKQETQAALSTLARLPMIGISGGHADSKSLRAMQAQVRKAGGIPVLLTDHHLRDAAHDIQKLDALFVMGNDFDIDPIRYIHRYAEGDARARVHPNTLSHAACETASFRAGYEEALLALAMAQRLPTLAVCGGMQLLNVLCGGGLLQHIPDLIGHELYQQHYDHVSASDPVVSVTLDQHSTLARLVAQDTVRENSFHHQAIDPDCLGHGLRITATSDRYTNHDGQRRHLPEAIEPDPQGPLADWQMVGVQWHPEFTASPLSASLIAATIGHAASYAATRQLIVRTAHTSPAFAPQYSTSLLPAFMAAAPQGLDAYV